MAYRQYIGARYVPLFDGPWSATKNYEPLTVVEDGNGNSYTSKKDVPAGTPLTDRNYWMLTASFSGAVEQLRRDVNAINDEIDGIDVKDAEQDGRLDILEDMAGKLQRKVLLLGDSYSWGVNNQSGVYASGGWMQRFDAAHPELVKDVSLFYSADGVSTGSGNRQFSNEGSTATYDATLNWWARVKLPELGVNPDDITDIILLGGTNDFYKTPASILAGGDRFAAVKKQYFPNAVAKIGVLAGWCRNLVSDSLMNLRNEYLKQTVDLYRENANKHGFTYITNSEFICANANMFNDGEGFHPSEAGYDMMAKYTNGLLDADAVDVLYTEAIPDAIDTSTKDFAQATYGTVFTVLHNETMTISFPADISNIFRTLNTRIKGTIMFDFSLSFGDFNTKIFNAKANGNTNKSKPFAPFPITFVGKNGNNSRVIYSGFAKPIVTGDGKLKIEGQAFIQEGAFDDNTYVTDVYMPLLHSATMNTIDFCF